MLRHGRALWRRSRAVPWFRVVVEAADRAWWARTIRKANVVDVDYVRAQGVSGGPRRAIRSYVRGGFRRGVSLNPLFMERLVSSQLSDAGRVPALYAYLVNDQRTVRTSVGWDAVGYAAAEPASLADPGGPLGHAWRTARTSGRIELGFGDTRATVPWGVVREAVDEAVRWSATPSVAPRPRRLTRPHAFVCRIAANEPRAWSALDAASEVARRMSADVVIALEGGRADVWTASSLVALIVDGVSLTVDDGAVDRVTSATTAEVLMVRGPNAEISTRDLLALAHSAADGPVAPLWLSDDGSIAAAGVVLHSGRRYHLLSGHPAEDANGLEHELIVAETAGGTYARPLGAAGARSAKTLLSLTVRAPDARPDAEPVDRADSPVDALVAPLGLTIKRWREDGPVFDRTPSGFMLDDGTVVPTLRWAIKTAAPAGSAGEAWGDTHFARGIAEALRRLGQEVVIDAYSARLRTSRYLDDVVVALRGPEPIEPQKGAVSLLWIISHPDEITAAGVEGFDVVFAGSHSWAASAGTRFGRAIEPLLQCTDVRRFHPRGLPRSQDLVFVGTARGIPRPSVIEPVRAGIPVRVYGPDWRGWIPASSIVAYGVPNADLPALYEGARAVLNDHWPAMQANGFISNRLYDVVAAGGRVISDAVDGIEDIFSGAVLTYDSVPELLGVLKADLDRLFPREDALAEIAARVRREHSFDARARTLLNAALRARSSDLRARPTG